MFDKIKKLFVVEDDDPLKKALEQKSQKEAEVTAPTEEMVADRTLSTQNPKPKAQNTQANGGKVTDKFMNILLGAMEKNNLDGFDYLEYKQSLQSLQNMDMDEATRYQSAFAMAKTMGATPKKLLETANHYVNVLKTEEQKFGQALISQKEKQIGNRRQRLEQLDQAVEHKRKQIEQLTKEIETHEQESTQIKEQITDASVKVENTKNNFVVTYQLLTGQIQEDIRKMQSYLK
jgi:hypothetical protein